VTQKIIDSIRNETDLIVAVTHEGVDYDSLLAVGTHGLNVIIGGHSHTRLTSPKLVNGVIICQAGSNCENLGELELTVEDRKVTRYDGKLIPLWARADRPETDMSKFVNEFKEKVDKNYGGVLGTLAADWKRVGRGESNIGNFVVDAMREAASADIAVTNSSGIRKDMSAGPLRKLDLFEIMPFRNSLCTFAMTGTELKAFAQRYAQALADGNASTQVSGLKCTWKRSPEGIVLEELSVNGKAVDDKASYTCATSDFVVNQADKYLGFVPPNVSYSDTTVFQALVGKATKEKSIHTQIENRFQEIR
jgi:2',3'-cyclic-nucleotide 2'-phosphodiesterase (5'-nucleotidase family)